ncbi:hypothetical protein [Brevundimonas sp.]|uniref:hypothetical protein n=1 Tax=Brevundimonas sp. TaxID=1871086 RepID=UPI002FDA534A
MNRLSQSIKFAGKWIGHGFLELWNLLWRAETPLIVTVGLAVAAAWLSPIVTEKFERQRMRSEYVLANLRELNGLISEVYVQVTAINYAVAAGGEAPKENITKARETLAKLNWKIIETAAMLPKDQRRILQRFQNNAFAVSQSLDGKLDVAGCQTLLRRVNDMALAGAQSIQAVGRYVDLGSSPALKTDRGDAAPANA